MACRACASRTPPQLFRSAETGTLHTWSVVERSYPGVKVPFVSAIVDLDGGLALKGTVSGVDHAALRQGQLGESLAAREGVRGHVGEQGRHHPRVLAGGAGCFRKVESGCAL